MSVTLGIVDPFDVNTLIVRYLRSAKNIRDQDDQDQNLGRTTIFKSHSDGLVFR